MIINRSDKLILLGTAWDPDIARIVSFSYTDIDAAIFMVLPLKTGATVLCAEFLTKFG